MKALVTGGAGFIGSHIAEALCRRGAKVVVLDDLSEGALKNLAWRQDGHDLEFVRGGIEDEKLVRQVMTGCDWVFHEAAVASVPKSVAEPMETNSDNLTGSLGLLIAARDAKVKRFVFASSSAIYGNNDVPAKHENLLPDPLSPYALQKYASEKYGQLFCQLYGLETVSLRYFNVFGPRQSFNSPYSGVIARFCTSFLKKETPTIFGDGLQSRDFIYIDNVVAANLLAAEAPAGQAAGKVFNVAGGQSITLLQLVGELNRLTGQSIQPRIEPARAGDVRSSQADISAARHGLGYEPRVAWQTGLERTLDFYRENGH
ncbi:MAG TPA: NAD-dependent epimerase/dehydratase family protein [Verrucomicrobiae bacterium]|nr:NAD-dependent epimerase/dehydratase family protein [Verrucomicrobiae bacterium]